MDAVWLAIIAGVSAGVSTVLSLVITAWIKRKEKDQDWARQDAVAAQAAEAARLLSDRQDKAEARAEETARVLVVSNKKVADAAAAASKVTDDKIDVVHTLVNSKMTEAMQGEFDATKQNLVLLIRLADKAKAGGDKPSVADLAEIEVTKTNIAELDAALTDRLDAAHAVEEQQKLQRAGMSAPGPAAT